MTVLRYGDRCHVNRDQAFGLHFIGIGIPISGLLHQVGKDARPTAASVAKELGALLDLECAPGCRLLM
jgi:hypothetical protein